MNSISGNHLGTLAFMIKEMKRNGDISDRLHHIHHFSYFASRNDADFFVEWLYENGYVAIDRFKVRKRCWRVSFCNTGPAHVEYLKNCIRTVETIVQGSEGVYEGWKLPVMSADVPDAPVFGAPNA